MGGAGGTYPAPRAGSTTPRERSRGGIVKLSSGALRAYVYDGLDPVSGRRHYLRETVPAGPEAQKLAEKALRRLTHQASAALATFGWSMARCRGVIGAAVEQPQVRGPGRAQPCERVHFRACGGTPAGLAPDDPS